MCWPWNDDIELKAAWELQRWLMIPCDFGTFTQFKYFSTGDSFCRVVWCHLQQRWKAFFHLQQADESHLPQGRSPVAGTPTAWRVDTSKNSAQENDTFPFNLTADVCLISEANRLIHTRISSPESSLTCPAGGGCYWHRPAWRWSSDRGWRGSEVLSFEHSSLAHIAWPCRVPCLQHVSPQLHDTAGQQGSINQTWRGKKLRHTHQSQKSDSGLS